MALDTVSKRLSVMTFGVAGLTLPIPDGTIAKGDRQHLLGIPSSADVSAAFPETGEEGGTVQVKAYVSSGLADGGISVNYDILGGGAGTGTSGYSIASCNATLRNLRIQVPTAPSGGYWIGTVYVNDVATVMVATIDEGEFYGDYTGSISIVEGDRVRLHVVGSDLSVGGGTGHFRWSVDHESDTAGQSTYSGHPGGGLNTGTTYYLGMFTPSVWSTTRALVENVSPINGTITKFFLQLASLGLVGGDSIACHIVKNGVVQDGTGGTVDTLLTLTAANHGGAAISASFSLDVAPSDTFAMKAVKSGTSGGVGSVYPAFQLTADINGESVVCGVGNDLHTTNTEARFNAVNNNREGTNTAETYPFAWDCGITPFTLKYLYLITDQAAGTGDSWTFHLRRNNTNPSGGQTVSISGVSQTVATPDTTNFVDFESGDLVSFRHLVGGTPAATTTASWGMVMYTATPGGGEIPPGTNPAPGDPEGTLHFLQVVINGTSYFAAESIIRDPQTAWGCKKAAELVSISSVRRELSQDYRASTFSVEVVDPDRRWRGFSATDTLESVYCAVYRCSAPNGVIEGTPFRIAAGVVKPGGFTAEEGYKFRFECVDVLGSYFTDPENQPEIPNKKLTVAEFWGMDPSVDGSVAQRCFGLLQETGFGVVPGIYMGRINPSIDLHPSGINALFHVGIISESSVYDVTGLYINPLVWTEGQTVFAGQYVIPTPDNASAGADYLFVSTNSGTTGGTEPTWPATGTVADNGITWEVVGLHNPAERITVDASQYEGGTDFTHSHAANWTAVTGLADPWVDWFDGRRYTIYLLRETHHYGEALKEGRVVPLFDVIGAATDVDVTGPPLLDPGYLHAHLLLTHAFGDSSYTTDATHPTLPGLDGEPAYTVIDTDSADDAKAVADAEGGYVMGFVAGADGQPSGLYDILGDLLRGGALDVGQNRHGQLMYSRRDTTASAVITFKAQKDYRSTKYNPDPGRRYTRAEWRYGPRYHDLIPPSPTPEPGDPSDNGVVARAKGQWASGQLRHRVAAAETALGTAFGQARKRTLVYDNAMTRDGATALSVITRELDYAVGPGPSYHGTPLLEITGPDERLLMALDSNGKTRELGDVIAIDDAQGLSSTGYTAKTFRIVWIDHDPQRYEVTFGCELLDSTVATLVAVS